MENNIILPSLTNIGVFDAKIKFGDISVTKPRKVYSFEIELPAEDGGTSYINNKDYSISCTHIICAKPGQTRYTHLPFKCYYIHLLIDKGSIYESLISMPDVFEIKSKQAYHEIFADIISSYNSTMSQNSFLLHSMILKLIYMMKCDALSHTNTGFSNPRANTSAIQKSVAYLDEHFCNSLTLKDIASRVYLSPIYFRNLFYDTVGISPSEYILKKRLNKAKDMLILTDLSLADIAFSCGFLSQSYFNYVFKKSIGITPKQYRINSNNKYPL